MSNDTQPKELAYDYYWRLDTYTNSTRRDLWDALDKAGKPRGNIRDKPELVELKHRLDCGRLCYDSTHLTLSDLHSFINARHLSLPVSGSRKGLEAVLHAADECATFERFLRLAPELREKIIQFYFGGFRGAKLRFPTQPPLARVNRLLRREVLALFFGEMCFEIDLLRIVDVEDKAARPKLRPCFQTMAFLNSIPKEYSGCLRKIQFNVSSVKRAAIMHEKRDITIWFKVDCSKDWLIRATIPGKQSLSVSVAAMWKAWRENLFRAITDIHNRKGVRRLCIEDVYHLRKVFEELGGGRVHDSR